MRHTRTAIIIFLLGSTALPAGAQQNTAEQGFLGTIVLGERTERPLSETYTGATVLDADALQEAAAPAHINDTLSDTPNLFVEGKSEVPSLRGVQGGGPGGTVSAGLTGALPRLSFVLDGVTRPVVLPNSSGASLWDVRQIEVLRGPQSLLRGRSAYAGAIIVETNDPTFTPEYALQFGVEDDGFHGLNTILNGMISGPLSDTVAGRLTFSFADGSDPRRAADVPDGWIVDYDNIQVRGKLRGTFETNAGALNVDLLAEHQSGQTPQTRNTVQTTALTGRPLEERLLDNSASGPLGIPSRTFDTETNVLSADVGLELSFGTLRSITSYVDDSYVSIPEQVYPFPFDVEETIKTQEFLFEFGPDERVRTGQWAGLIGLSYEERDQKTDIGGLFSFNSTVETRSTSLFADLRYGISDQLTVFGGARVLRYADRRQQASQAGPVAGQQSFDETETEILPALGLAYYFDENRVLSAAVKKGYNPGGSSVNIFTGQPYVYDSETVTTAEITYRHAAPSGLFSFGVTGFYNDFDNPQLYAELVPGNRASLQVVNQVKGKSYGLEVDAQMQATERLRLSMALGLLETEITTPQAGNPALAGNAFGQDPSVTLSLGAGYQINDRWSIDARATYRGSSFNDFNNIAADKVGDYWIVDAGVTAIYGNTEFRGYIKNAFDETGVTRFVAGSTYADVTDPVTVGFTVTSRW